MTPVTELVQQQQARRFLEGKSALITGGSRGIGRGIAVKLAECGARVAVTYFQNESAAQDTVERIKRQDSDGDQFKLDVGDVNAVQRLVDQVGHQYGSVDILISNARGEVPTFYAPPFTITDEQFASALHTQATAFFHLVRATNDLMPAGGRVIALTYGTGSRTGSWQPWVAMGAAKAAVEALVRYFAVALAKRDITVNAVSPGFIEDSVVNSLPEPVQNMIREWHEGGWTPKGHLGTPADIGNVVSLLCRPEASWITGQTIYADGGASIVSPELPPVLQGFGS
jgi:NAD(P)-dependent dehydrogenase (short-subunit alcohol dehydrogenase family)